MELKDLNDTLIAHEIFAFAIELQRCDLERRKAELTIATTILNEPLETFIPRAAARYWELREEVKINTPAG